MRENYQPFHIGNRFIVVPPESHYSANDRIPLIMERGAFGSGEHETTKSCIELLEKLPPGLLPVLTVLSFFPEVEYALAEWLIRDKTILNALWNFTCKKNFNLCLQGLR